MTPKRLMYLLAVVTLVVAAALILDGGAVGLHASSAKTQSLSTDDSSTNNVPAQTRSAQTGPVTTAAGTSSAADDNGNTGTNLTVNGQDISVPADGVTHQTTVDGDGGHTTVSANHSQGSVGNRSSTNISIHVQSSSSSGDAD